jgi:hypothetical protein
MANTKKASRAALVSELDPAEIITVEILGETYRLRKKFRRLRFLRKLVSDPISALELVFLPEDLERLEDIEMGEADLNLVFEAVSEALVGGPKG